jgi:hypothetical protein
MDKNNVETQTTLSAIDVHQVQSEHAPMVIQETVPVLALKTYEEFMSKRLRIQMLMAKCLAMHDQYTRQEEWLKTIPITVPTLPIEDIYDLSGSMPTHSIHLHAINKLKAAVKAKYVGFIVQYQELFCAYSCVIPMDKVVSLLVIRPKVFNKQ